MIQILATPLIAITLLLVTLERVMHIGIFDSAVGLDPILFQQILWFDSHFPPYLMILPGMGVFSEVIACFSRERIFGYAFVAASFFGIAVLCFLMWGQTHPFISLLPVIPFAVTIFNWLVTMRKGSLTLKSPMLFAFAFIGLFAIGGLTGLYWSTLTKDFAMHGTYFLVENFHSVLFGGTAIAFMAGLHFWWPKISGRRYPESWAKFSAVWLFLGFNLTFISQYLLGYLGMPRRYAAYPPEFQALLVLSSTGAFFLGSGFLIPVVYLTWSWFYGPKAGQNTWNAAGLEWQIDSPPITTNFPDMPTGIDDAPG